eukprot:3091349-Heterocapsa_arctica.AAC.1
MPLYSSSFWLPKFSTPLLVVAPPLYNVIFRPMGSRLSPTLTHPRAYLTLCQTIMPLSITVASASTRSTGSDVEVR